jgi:hypothetical protein
MIYRRAVLSVSTALFGGNNFFGGLVGGYGIKCLWTGFELFFGAFSEE